MEQDNRMALSRISLKEQWLQPRNHNFKSITDNERSRGMEVDYQKCEKKERNIGE